MGHFELLTHSTYMVVFFVGTGGLGTMYICTKCPDNRVNIAETFDQMPLTWIKSTYNSPSTLKKL